MIVLALNCGSSSLTFQVFAHDPAAASRDARRPARGGVERIGGEAMLALQTEGSPATRTRSAQDVVKRVALTGGSRC